MVLYKRICEHVWDLRPEQVQNITNAKFEKKTNFKTKSCWLLVPLKVYVVYLCVCMRIHKRVLFEPVKKARVCAPIKRYINDMNIVGTRRQRFRWKRRKKPRPMRTMRHFYAKKVLNNMQIHGFNSVGACSSSALFISFDSFLPVSQVLDVENKWQNGERKKLLNADKGVDCAVW